MTTKESRFVIGRATKSDYQRIIEVWEASVRPTHTFLTEADIQYFKPLILNQYLDAVKLFSMRESKGEIIGFSGILENKLEMLFVHPDYFGKGAGKALMNHAILEENIDEVDVNEQNEGAVHFYKHMGFVVIGRSPVDSLGKPFPILSLKLSRK